MEKERVTIEDPLRIQREVQESKLAEFTSKNNVAWDC